MPTLAELHSKPPAEPGQEPRSLTLSPLISQSILQRLKLQILGELAGAGLIKGPAQAGWGRFLSR